MENPKGKKSMSVVEMGRMLGLSKTESYWLIKKKYFTTIIAGKRMRVMLDSFEAWYAGQTHYKKVDQERSKDNGFDCEEEKQVFRGIYLHG